VEHGVKPTGIARFTNIVVNVALVLMVLGPILMAIVALAPDGTAMRVRVPSDAVSALPDNARLAPIVPVALEIEDPTAKQSLAVFLWGVPPFALGIVVLAFLRGIVGSVRRGDPFIADNVRRLRAIAFALIIGGPLVQILMQFFTSVVAESAGVRSAPFRLDIPGAPPVIGLGVLLLAQVFAHGVQLREDVEGTV
jgi:hypothetical protein